MTTPRDIGTPFARITWRDGQTLAAADLRDDQGYIDRLRYLHIRYQHKTWGVVEGLKVVADGTGGVRVSPGYALDIEGRELLLPAMKVPGTPLSTPVDVTMYLVITLATGSSGCSQPPDLTLLCPGARNPVLVEMGVLSWKTVNQVRVGYDVLLARALMSNGMLAGKVDPSVRRRAASMRQSRMWSDVTQAGQTGWTDAARETLPGITATVDTSDAGFVTAPAYFASLTGGSQFARTYIASAHTGSFTFVAVPASAEQGFKADKPLTAAMAENAGLAIAWFAIELQKGPWT